MNKSITSLIGITDTLIHLMETEKAARNSPDLARARARLEKSRKALLAEGFRHGRIVAAARDAVTQVAGQLEGHLTSTDSVRDVKSIVRGLAGLDVLDVEPPPLPSSSSSGPKSEDLQVLKLATALINALAQAGVVIPAVGGKPTAASTLTTKGKRSNTVIMPNGQKSKD